MLRWSFHNRNVEETQTSVKCGRKTLEIRVSRRKLQQTVLYKDNSTTAKDKFFYSTKTNFQDSCGNYEISATHPVCNGKVRACTIQLPRGEIRWTVQLLHSLELTFIPLRLIENCPWGSVDVGFSSTQQSKTIEGALRHQNLRTRKTLKVRSSLLI